MIILKVDTNPQSFKFIPRSKTYDGLFLKDESENKTTQITIDSTASNDYYETITATFHTSSPAFDLVENRFYRLLVKNGTDIVFRDRVFVTNQTDLSNYSVNNGVYNSNSSTNEFIIYE
tara:strand:+ start:1097 stop:1453 length:357 start_codon:yes stop_codon:yes gene_type:complete